MRGNTLKTVQSVARLRRVRARNAAEAVLVGALWWYTASVFYPVRLLKARGVDVMGGPIGEPPAVLPRPGLGPRFSGGAGAPRLLEEPSEHAELVEEFDELAELYEVLVRPFSTPIVDEALTVIGRYLTGDSRVLDAGCGPGREARRIASLVPRGEVVGVDLAAGMVTVAHDEARRRGITNCSFVQADVGELPHDFDGAFDLVYSCLAHHHYPDPPRAAAGVFRCLRPGGVYCIVDPGPGWFNALSAPLGRLADPGWMGWKTPEEFRALLDGAGFESTCWIPLLPGLGLAAGRKPSGAAPAARL